jgi:TRAP-type uncharacterized transport system substrate-binding protein
VASPLDRPLAARRPSTSVQHFARRIAAILAVFAVVGLLVSRIDFTHDLHRLHVRVLSGAPEGNYHALVARLADRAAKQKGVVENLTSAGSAENVERLAEAAKSCDVAFALSQDGLEWDPTLRLIGRLSKAESVLFLGKNGDAIEQFVDLKGLRVGVGPAGSGSDRIARQIFGLADFAPLAVVLSNHPLDEQLAMAARGDLDLAMLVIDADAPLVEDWVARRGLQIASFAHTEGVARRLPHLRSGHVGAGVYDAVRSIPKVDKSVMKVETLVLTNGCAGRVASMDFLGLLAAEVPDFVRNNKGAANNSAVPLAPAATDYFANDGPQLADEYLPWLVDVMPPANWAYVVMAVSLLFNAMGFGHRFRLWRIDAMRVKLEGDLSHLFPPSTTLGDIQRTPPDAKFTKAETTAVIDRVVKDLEELAARSRRYSLSVLVPMGQEMAYRYQEGVIYETLAVLRDFKRRALDKPSA